MARYVCSYRVQLGTITHFLVICRVVLNSVTRWTGYVFGGLVIGLMATPAVRQLARRIGFLDQPDGRRKVHARPTAVGGGAAVLVSIVLAVALAALCGAATPTGLLPLFIAVAVIFTVGLVDDVRQLDGRIKLILQGCVACGFVAVAGAPNAVGLLGLHLPLGSRLLRSSGSWAPSTPST